MATHCSVLAWRISGTAEPGGLLSMGLHRFRHDWSDLAAAAAMKINLMSSIRSVHKVNALWTCCMLLFGNDFPSQCHSLWHWACSLEHVALGDSLLYLSSRLRSTLLTLYQTAGFPWIFSQKFYTAHLKEKCSFVYDLNCLSQTSDSVTFLSLRWRDKCQWTPTSWECKVQISATPVLLPKSSQCIQKLRW